MENQGCGWGCNAVGRDPSTEKGTGGWSTYIPPELFKLSHHSNGPYYFKVGKPTIAIQIIQALHQTLPIRLILLQH